VTGDGLLRSTDAPVMVPVCTAAPVSLEPAVNPADGDGDMSGVSPDVPARSSPVPSSPLEELRGPALVTAAPPVPDRVNGIDTCTPLDRKVCHSPSLSDALGATSADVMTDAGDSSGAAGLQAALTALDSAAAARVSDPADGVPV
jgi:hypothetical protein